MDVEWGEEEVWEAAAAEVAEVLVGEEEVSDCFAELAEVVGREVEPVALFTMLVAEEVAESTTLVAEAVALLTMLDAEAVALLTTLEGTEGMVYCWVMRLAVRYRSDNVKR